MIEMIREYQRSEQTIEAEHQTMIGSLHSDDQISEAAEGKCSGRWSDWPLFIS